MQNAERRTQEKIKSFKLMTHICPFLGSWIFCSSKPGGRIRMNLCSYLELGRWNPEPEQSEFLSEASI